MSYQSESSKSGKVVLYNKGFTRVSHGQVFRFLHDEVEVPRYEVAKDEQESESRL